MFIAEPACFKILVLYHLLFTHPFHSNFHSIFLGSKDFWLRFPSMNYVHNDKIVIAVVTWHISAKFLFWGGGVVGGKKVYLYEVSKILFLRRSRSF